MSKPCSRVLSGPRIKVPLCVRLHKKIIDSLNIMRHTGKGADNWYQNVRLMGMRIGGISVQSYFEYVI